MTHRNKNERLNLYRRALSYGWKYNLNNRWPIKLNAAFHLFLKEFGEEFIEDMAYLEEDMNYHLKDISHAFYNPARIFRITDSVIYSMRTRKISLVYQREFILKMLDMIKYLKYGSEFNEDGRNIIYSPSEIKSLVSERIEGRSCTLEESVWIHRFCGLIWAYTESIFFRAHDVTKEIHGPYYYDSHHSNIIVKEYLNLYPQEIWPQVTLVPCHTIKIVKSYTTNMSLRIDSLNHLYYEGEELVPNLKSYYIEVDGKQGSIEGLRSVMKSIEQAISQITRILGGMTWHDKVVQYARIFWYRKKPLRDLIGSSWKLPEHVQANIYAGTENHSRLSDLSEKDVHRLAMLTI